MSEDKKDIKESVKGLGFKSIVSGDFLSDGRVMRNLPYLAFVAFLMVIYVAYGYYADHVIRDLANEEKRSEELYSELQSLMEVYDMESLQSKVASEIEVRDIYEAKDPPRTIEFKLEKEEK